MDSQALWLAHCRQTMQLPTETMGLASSIAGPPSLLGLALSAGALGGLAQLQAPASEEQHAQQQQNSSQGSASSSESSENAGKGPRQNQPKGTAKADSPSSLQHDDQGAELLSVGKRLLQDGSKPICKRLCRSASPHEVSHKEANAASSDGSGHEGHECGNSLNGTGLLQPSVRPVDIGLKAELDAGQRQAMMDGNSAAELLTQMRAAQHSTTPAAIGITPRSLQLAAAGSGTVPSGALKSITTPATPAPACPGSVGTLASYASAVTTALPRMSQTVSGVKPPAPVATPEADAQRTEAAAAATAAVQPSATVKAASQSSAAAVATAGVNLRAITMHAGSMEQHPQLHSLLQPHPLLQNLWVQAQAQAQQLVAQALASHGAQAQAQARGQMQSAQLQNTQVSMAALMEAARTGGQHYAGSLVVERSSSHGSVGGSQQAQQQQAAAQAALAAAHAYNSLPAGTLFQTFPGANGGAPTVLAIQQPSGMQLQAFTGMLQFGGAGAAAVPTTNPQLLAPLGGMGQQQLVLNAGGPPQGLAALLAAAAASGPFVLQADLPGGLGNSGGSSAATNSAWVVGRTSQQHHGAGVMARQGSGAGLDSNRSAGGVSSPSVSVGHGQSHGTAPVPRVRRARDPATISKVQQCALQIMRMIGSKMMYERQIRGALGNNPDTSKALRLLMTQGKLTRMGLGGRGDPFAYVATSEGLASLDECTSH